MRIGIFFQYNIYMYYSGNSADIMKFNAFDCKNSCVILFSIIGVPAGIVQNADSPFRPSFWTPLLD